MYSARSEKKMLYFVSSPLSLYSTVNRNSPHFNLQLKDALVIWRPGLHVLLDAGDLPHRLHQLGEERRALQDLEPGVARAVLDPVVVHRVGRVGQALQRLVHEDVRPGQLERGEKERKREVFMTFFNIC